MNTDIMGEAMLLHIDLSNLSNETGDNDFRFREELISSLMSWDNLQLKIKYIAGRNDITISYYDEDGDIVLIESQDELQEAYKVALKMDNILPVVIMTRDGVPITRKPVEKSTPLELSEKTGESEKKNPKTRDEHVRVEKKKMKCQVNACETETHKKKMHKKTKATGERSEARYCHPETGEVASGPLDTREALPPVWFQHYMNKFRKEMATEFSKVAAEKTARRVVRSMNSMSSQRKCELELGKYTSLSTPKNEVTHVGAPCKGCLKSIVGIRYKCGNCVDFDLCEACEEMDGIHDNTHVFLKIRQPLRRKHNIWHVPLLKKNLYQTKESRANNGKSKYEDEEINEKAVAAVAAAAAAAAAKGDNEDHGLGGAFIRDDNIPDGTHMQPRTRFTKRWIVKNIGQVAWTPDVKLMMLEGQIDCTADSVPVPPLAPEETGCVAVDLIAPAEPGNYEATWVMVKGRCEFGHQLWCSIVVDVKEVLEPLLTVTRSEICPFISTSYAEEEVPLLGAMSQLEGSVEEAVVLCSDEEEEDRDVMGAELLSEHCPLAKLSHTATPSNTPLAHTPPMTPMPQLEACIRSLTLSDPQQLSANHVDDELEALFDDARADEYLEFADCYDDTDVNSDSSDDSDFFIVPVPDCFRTDLPASLTASTTRKIPKPNTAKISNNSDDTKDDNKMMKLEDTDAETVATEMAAEAQAEPVNAAFADAVNVEAATDSASECDTADEEVEKEEDVTDNATEATAAAAAAGMDQSTNGDVAVPYDPLADLGELAWNGAKFVGAAALWGAKKAKNIYQHMQTHNEYVPPQSSWSPLPSNYTPPVSNWTPRASNWTPRANNWTPSKPQWVPPQGTWVSTSEEWLHSAEDRNHKMLLDMGFANREHNQRLLLKHNNDVHAVISELIAENDNDWSARRH